MKTIAVTFPKSANVCNTYYVVILNFSTKLLIFFEINVTFAVNTVL